MGCLVCIVFFAATYLSLVLAEKYDNGFLYITFFILFMLSCACFGALVDGPLSKKSSFYRELKRAQKRRR